MGGVAAWRPVELGTIILLTCYLVPCSPLHPLPYAPQHTPSLQELQEEGPALAPPQNCAEPL